LPKRGDALMAIKERDLKLLWGRSANRCAICRIELTFDALHSSDAVPLGEQAHIVAKEPGGPRGDSILTLEERDSYSNLILLCPTHHTVIDKVEGDYPIEQLHLIKTTHELWVQATLSGAGDEKAAANSLIYTSLIDAAVECLKLESWKAWTSWLLLAGYPKLSLGMPEKVEAFAHKVIAAPWPGTLEELERSIQTLAFSSNEAINVFLANAKQEHDEWVGRKDYKEIGWNPDLYEAKFAEWDKWIDDLLGLVRETTKAANWFADVVRRDINPRFFATEGRFLLTEGPNMDLSFTTYMTTYTTEEKQGLPRTFLEKRRAKREVNQIDRD
jgi:hypothetical protein